MTITPIDLLGGCELGRVFGQVSHVLNYLFLGVEHWILTVVFLYHLVGNHALPGLRSAVESRRTEGVYANMFALPRNRFIELVGLSMRTHVP